MPPRTKVPQRTNIGAVRHWMALLLPLAVVAGNIGLFLVTSSLIVSGSFGFSHHWLFLLHEVVLLAQVFLLKPPYLPVRTLASLSLLVLGVAIARLETIYLSHHLMQFSLAFIAGIFLHLRLYSGRKNSWRRFNGGLAVFCAVVAVTSAVIALRYGIWWSFTV